MSYVSARHINATEIASGRTTPEVVRPGEVDDPHVWSRARSMDALGSVVYAARLGDGTIKIGHTGRLSHRLHKLGSYRQCSVDLLAFCPGTYEDEQEIHASLVESRAHGREYYHPTPVVIAVVNEMRSVLGLAEVAA